LIIDMKKNTVLIAVAVVLVALFALLVKGCQTMAGGPVGTTDEFRDHVRATTDAGDSVYRALSPAPVDDPYPSQDGSSSCVDDFGWDDGDVTRDQPIFTWDLDFASTDDFRAALKALEADWREDGREVEKVENGIATTLDDDVRVTFHLGWYSDKPELRAEGRCMRYDNGDGTVDEYEKPSW